MNYRSNNGCSNSRHGRSTLASGSDDSGCNGSGGGGSGCSGGSG